MPSIKFAMRAKPAKSEGTDLKALEAISPATARMTLLLLGKDNLDGRKKRIADWLVEYYKLSPDATVTELEVCEKKGRGLGVPELIALRKRINDKKQRPTIDTPHPSQDFSSPTRRDPTA